MPAIFADNEPTRPTPTSTRGARPAATPRFRAEGSDWADADFADDDLTDETRRLGALAEASVVDDDEAFERDLAERRRRTPRGARRAHDGHGLAVDRDRATATRAARPPTRATPASSSRRPRRSRDLPTALVDRGESSRSSRSSASRRERSGPSLLAAVDRRGSARSSSPPGCKRAASGPRRALALAGAFFLPIAARRVRQPTRIPCSSRLIVVFSLLWFLWEITPGRPLLGVATTVFAFAYVGGLGGFAGLLLGSHDGVGLILGVALCVITYDVVGFFVGSQFGKSAIAPRVSPNKSFEGTLAGMVGVGRSWAGCSSAARSSAASTRGRPARARCSGCSSRRARSSATCASRC